MADVIRYVDSRYGLDTYDGTTATVGGGHGPWQTLYKACTTDTPGASDRRITYCADNGWSYPYRGRDNNTGATVTFNWAGGATAGNPNIWNFGGAPVVASQPIPTDGWSIVPGYSNVWKKSWLDSTYIGLIFGHESDAWADDAHTIPQFFFGNGTRIPTDYEDHHWAQVNDILYVCDRSGRPDLSGVVLEYQYNTNVIYTNAHYHEFTRGLIFGGSDRPVFINNIAFLHRNLVMYGTNNILLQGSSNGSKIYYNIIAGMTSQVLTGTGIQFDDAGQINTIVYNNTILEKGTAIKLAAGAGGAGAILIKNNILADCTTAFNMGSGANYVEQYNAIGLLNTDIYEISYGLTPDATDIKENKSGDSTKSVKQLSVTDAEYYDLRLNVDSACINAGTNVSLTEDYAGNSVIGNPDIGALEFVGTAYSREATGSLPTTSINLATIYSDAEVTNVATVNSIFVSQSASNQYAIHEFKNDASGKSTCTVTWTGQNSMGNTAGYPTILEIYNTTGAGSWEELDRDTSAAADTNFTLSFPILSGLDNYKDDNGFITCRVYQSSIGR